MHDSRRQLRPFRRISVGIGHRLRGIIVVDLSNSMVWEGRMPYVAIR